MSGVSGRARPPSTHIRDMAAVFSSDCNRCGRPVYATAAIPMECFGCVQAAQAIWPWAQPIAGEMSGE